MEITPRRSLSLNLETTNKYFCISSPIREMWTSQSMKASMATPPGGYRMSHSLSMDDTRVNPNLQKKDNTIFKAMFGVFGSLSSIVSKIPTFISNINNPLSVTVVSNEGIISPEYILKNLTQSVNHESPEPNGLKLFDEIQENPVYNSKSNIAEIFADRVGGKLLDVKSWIEGLQDAQESLNSFNESNDLDLAIQESLKHMKCQPKKFDDEMQIQPNENKLDLNAHIKQNIDENSIKLDNKLINTEISEDTMIEKIDDTPLMANLSIITDQILASGVSSSAVVDDNSTDDRMECEIPSIRSQLHKTKRKTNTFVRSRGKAKGKYQLRKSGVSQFKHRKERTKQTLYSNIQDDLCAWEEVGDDSSEEINCCLPSVEKDADAYHIPDYPMFIESFVLDDSRGKRRQRKIMGDNVKLSYRVRFLPDCNKEEVLSPITDEFRQRLMSESSIDSEDSCCIVFEDESDCTCDSVDYEFGTSSDEEEEEDEEEERAGQKVRFNLKPAVHTMIQWNYAYRAARRGPWEEMARDRERFRGRINCIGRVLDPILTVKHRECIWRDRFAVDESIKK